MTALWEGERVRLQALEPGDVEVFTAADADTDGARAGWRVFPPRSSWAAGQWIEQATMATNDGDDFRVAIAALATGDVVGTLNTHSCDGAAGTCSYGIAVFPWQRRQGYASDAIVVVLRYLFGERRYQKCTVGVLAFNDASVALHESLGFQVEGRIRRARFVGGQHHDEIMLGLTVEEYAARWPLTLPT